MMLVGGVLLMLAAWTMYGSSRPQSMFFNLNLSTLILFMGVYFRLRAEDEPIEGVKITKVVRITNSKKAA